MPTIVEADALQSVIDEEIERIKSEKETATQREEERLQNAKRHGYERRVAITKMLIDLNALLQKALASSERLCRFMEERWPSASAVRKSGATSLVLWMRGLSEPRAVSLCVIREDGEKLFSVQLCWESFDCYGIRGKLSPQNFCQIPEDLDPLFTQYSSEVALARAIVRALHNMS